MKRLVFMIVIALLITGCSAPQAVETQQALEAPEIYEIPQEATPHHYSNFDRVVYESASRIPAEPTLDGISRFATNIVRGRIADDARMGIGEHGRPAANLVSLEILEVVKGELNVGEIITIIEPYIIDNRVLTTWDNYMPSTPNQEYFFFLHPPATRMNASEEFVGSFWVSQGERGRFPVPGGQSTMQAFDDTGAFSADTQDFSAAVFGLGSHADVDVYMSLWEEVMNAFMN